ncbi:MAG: aminomethyl-transferring glycine dehydrogenase subunit GcvPA [Candidatus Hydrogenedentes bacterium]|nr:aminomethyl-transferring glycine dehydrogenase subunit GcvPA [Candidatus Hydrogenedentota bacterium]
MDWTTITEVEKRDIFKTVGVEAMEELFAAIPESLRLDSWDMPEGKNESALLREFKALSQRNNAEQVCFMGGGYYDHYIPAAVDALAGRSEFYTAYTPYQPECSQGTLQAIYEYQSLICRLMDMECANASLYDGGTAIFEAAVMAARITKRQRVIVHDSVHPLWKQMLETHAAGSVLKIETGSEPISEETACVIVQNPAFLGTLQDYADLAQQCHELGALLVMAVNPVSLGIVRTPGSMGADITVAEGQSLGLPLGFGGPYLGILATKKKYIRKMPGRIVGAAADDKGRPGYVLTLQAREQHIRREKALSNICSNQALCALRALIHLCLLGKEGLRETAYACHAKTAYLMSKLDFVQVLNDGPVFNEFAVRLPKNAEVVAAALLEKGFLAGIPLHTLGCGKPNDLLVAVTEKRTRDELDSFAAVLQEACHE